MKRLLCAALLAASLSMFLAGCSKSGERVDMGDGMVGVNAADSEMNKAIAEAQSTLPDFFTKLSAKHDANDYFSVKVRMIGSEGQPEHIWVENVEKTSDTRGKGTLANDPVYLPGMKFGSPVEFDLKDVSDWMIRRVDGKMEGGFTVKVLQENGG